MCGGARHLGQVAGQ
nr:hypothetical protein [Mycobacterium tuberculosis]